MAILTLIAIPNISTYLQTSRAGAANAELAGVKLANKAYAADHHQIFATSSDDLGGYFNKPIRGSYAFDPDTGAIDDDPVPPSSGYDDVFWNPSKQKFE